MTLANFQNSWSTLAPVSIDKSACSPAGIMSPGLGSAELLRNCILDWALSGANKKLPSGLGPGSFLKKLQWGPVFLCQIEYGNGDTLIPNIVKTILNVFKLKKYCCLNFLTGLWSDFGSVPGPSRAPGPRGRDRRRRPGRPGSGSSQQSHPIILPILICVRWTRW